MFIYVSDFQEEGDLAVFYVIICAAIKVRQEDSNQGHFEEQA